MYSFEGQFRRKPEQNLAGASKKEHRDELLNRAHYERLMREVIIWAIYLLFCVMCSLISSAILVYGCMPFYNIPYYHMYEKCISYSLYRGNLFNMNGWDLGYLDINCSTIGTLHIPVS